MPLTQVNPGDRINASDLNQFYNLLKGVAASGEAVTLIYNAAGSVILQPSSDPATGTELIQIKNNAGTVQLALSSDGKLYAADGVVGTPALTFEADKDTGLYRTTTNTLDFAAGGTRIATVDANGITIQSGALKIGSATTKQMVSRYLNNAVLTLSASAAGYTDFGGSFTTSVTTLAGDQVCIRVQSIMKKTTGGSMTVVVDRGGTKLPAPTIGGSVYLDLVGSFIPFAFEYWDSPGAGTFTYKPQMYDADTNTAAVGGGNNCQFVVEVWR